MRALKVDFAHAAGPMGHKIILQSLIAAERRAAEVRLRIKKQLELISELEKRQVNAEDAKRGLARQLLDQAECDRDVERLLVTLSQLAG